MTLNKAVARLNSDLASLAKPSLVQHTAEHQYNLDVLKERAAIGLIDKQKKQITDQFVGATQPTGANELKLLNQLFALGQKRVTTTDSFAATLAKDKRVISADRGAVGKARARGRADLRPGQRSAW